MHYTAEQTKDGRWQVVHIVSGTTYGLIFLGIVADRKHCAGLSERPACLPAYNHPYRLQYGHPFLLTKNM